MSNECRNVTISAKRVLDSANKKLSLEHAKLLCHHIPTQAQEPFVFINAISTQIDAILSNLSVTRLSDSNGQARIRCDVTIPLQVAFKDATGEHYTCLSETVIAEDIVMFVPKPSMFPFEIVAVASCSCPSGCFVGEKIVDCAECVTIITKVITEADIIVPSYGYAGVPNAIDFDSKECEKFFNLPTYPHGKI